MNALPASAPERSDGPEGLLRRFDHALSEEGIELELCVVGGAVIQLAFVATPTTRRPRALFPDPETTLEARRRAAERGAVALDRLEEAARRLAAGRAGGGRRFDASELASTTFHGRALRVLDAPPDYVLAMRCAALAFEPESGAEDDIRYLLRFMGLRTADEAMEVIDAYLNPRQRPSDLRARLRAILE